MVAENIINKAQDITHSLGGKWNGGAGMACCPAHDDKHPSLYIKPGDKAVLFFCHAGCSSLDVSNALKNICMSQAPNYMVAKKDNRRGQSEFARALWEQAIADISGTLAQRYLLNRAINIISQAIRFDPNAKYRDHNGQLKSAPAMVTAYRSCKQVTAVQRTFLAPSGYKLPLKDQYGKTSAKRVIGDKRGACARLFPARDQLGLCEGIEDAMSIYQLLHIPAWAAGGVNQLPYLQIPASIKSVTIFGQHDMNPEIMEKARAHLGQSGRELILRLPPPDMDWNDAHIAISNGDMSVDSL